MMTLPSRMAWRLPHLTLALMLSLSAWAKAPSIVISISLSESSVLMFCSSKMTAMASQILCCRKRSKNFRTDGLSHGFNIMKYLREWSIH